MIDVFKPLSDDEVARLSALDDKRRKAAPGEWWEDGQEDRERNGYRESLVLFPDKYRPGQECVAFDTINAWFGFDPEERHLLGTWAAEWANHGRRALEELMLLRRAREVLALTFPESVDALDVAIGVAEKERAQILGLHDIKAVSEHGDE